MEIFSTDTRDGKIYEGTVRADGFGNFSFSKDTALSGPFLTATSRSSGDNTSELSPPTDIHTDIQIALDTIENEAPLYQTSFGSWDSDEPEGNANAWIENGKLLIASFNHENASVEIHSISSDRFAVEFELTILEASPEGHCVSGTSDDEIGESWRGLSFGFFSNGQLGLGHVVTPDITESLAMSRFGETKSNTVTAIILGDHIAAFINGQLAYTALDPDGSALTYQDLAATYTIVCEYDNYKVWDLSEVDFNPGGSLMNTNRVIFANPIKEQERLIGHEADIPLITNQCLYKGVSAMKNMSIVSLCAESHIT